MPDVALGLITLLISLTLMHFSLTASRVTLHLLRREGPVPGPGQNATLAWELASVLDPELTVVWGCRPEHVGYDKDLRLIALHSGNSPEAQWVALHELGHAMRRRSLSHQLAPHTHLITLISFPLTLTEHPFQLLATGTLILSRALILHEERSAWNIAQQLAPPHLPAAPELRRAALRSYWMPTPQALFRAAYITLKPRPELPSMRAHLRRTQQELRHYQDALHQP